MSFSSISFLIFVAAVCLVYFAVPSRAKWVVLLLASWTFYAFAGVKLIGFLLFTTATTYVAGILMGRADERSGAYAKKIRNAENDGSGTPLSPSERAALKKKTKDRKRVVLIIDLLLNFGLLVALKYNDYFPAVKEFLNSLGILLPLGISFYTFQSVGYLIDVFRGKYAPEKDPFRFALFVSFFPQLVQGPISRFDELAQQLYEPHKFSYERFVSGGELMLWGYFKKLVIADRINILVSFIFSNYAEYNGLYILFAGILYCIQIYCDFSGGMEIALGVAEILGIKLPQNFERPYFAKTLSEYWRRWHITLNQWLRDYLFYPISLSKLFVKLGQAGRKNGGRADGERKKMTFRRKFAKNIAIYIATMIVRIINAIWHGGAAKYFVNGIYHGLLMILSLQFASFFKWLKKVFRVNDTCFSYRLFMMLRTFTLVLIGRIMLHAEDFDQGIDMLKGIFAKFNPWIFFDGSMYTGTGMTRNSYIIMLLAIAVLIFTSVLKERGMQIRETLARQNIVFRWVMIFGLIFSIIIFGVYGKGYDASMFIYQQF